MNLNDPNIKLKSEEILAEKVKARLLIAITKIFPNIDSAALKLDHPSSLEHGDYASNIALQLSKEQQKPPRKIAESIVAELGNDELFQKAEIAGPGFINFFLSEKALSTEIETINANGKDYGSGLISSAKPIIVEYSCPNIAKPLGAHHLLTTVIGQSLYNLYKFIGLQAISINYIGDWGTQFGKLIYAYKTWGDRKEIEKDPIAELLKLYVHFHNEAEENPELEDQARYEFKIFEQGDKENRELWKWFVDESLKDVEKTYELLGGIHFDHLQGESFVENLMGEMLEEGKSKNIFVQGQEGSWVVEYEDPHIPPFLVQKKDGATLYATREFTTLKYRIQHWQPLKILYVVDVGQSLHFKQSFKAAERFDWYHDEAEHVSFGRMKMKDAKFSTRKGNIVLMEEVLNEAIAQSQKIIDEKGTNASAKLIGTAAVKYSILSQNRNTDIVFDWDKMLALEGNSAPYLQYTYARAKSILRKQDDDPSPETMQDADKTAEKIEQVVRLLPRFKEVLLQAASEYRPNIISNYLYQLAQNFNSFYNSVPVLRAEPEQRAERLKIVEAASHILSNGLALLGIETLESM